MLSRMIELVNTLNYATEAYDKGHPIMSDEEWDKLYFELKNLEESCGEHLAGSPTVSIPFSVVTSLRKVEHNHPMLSLDKTKDINEIQTFIHRDNQPFIIMSKLDGLTCSLRYLDGKLVSAETRGNGVIGEDILHNALVIPSIPNRISYTKELVIDGEIIIKYSDFVNFQNEYKNPRNLAAGSIRLLNSKECYQRSLTFIAWEVITGFEEHNLLSKKLKEIQKIGFEIVPNISTAIFDEELCNFINKIAQAKSYPVDGLVFKFDNVDYGKTLGSTSHHFKNAMAFKFYDEMYDTKLLGIDWTMGRTGVLTPVAIFESIDMDGSEVSRASLHNINIMQETLGTPWVGQPLKVFKANMIIPQIAEADKNTLVTSEKFIDIPYLCPICGGEVKNTGDNLICVNSACSGKLINRLDHFCGKKGLDIKGLSKATLEKLIDWNWVNSFEDIFNLKQYADEWEQKPGFGKKSVNNILNSIENSKNTTLSSFIASIGIPLIGNTVSKEIVKYINTYDEFREYINNKFDFSQLDGFAISKTESLLNFNYEEADKVYPYLIIENPVNEKCENKSLDGLVFVITGSLKQFKNRAELQSKIEELGGKVSSSVSKNTNYLINNDSNSNSSKNLTAQKLGIPIITEQDFIKNFLTF